MPLTPNELDPTAIEVNTDPLTKRFSGIAYHGNTPFDVPFISEVVPDLYQGGCDPSLVLPMGIKHLISLYPGGRYKVHHRLRTELYVRMYDSLDQSMGQLDAIAQLALVCWRDGSTLVHCQAGLNRSSLVVARTLMLDGWSAGEAIEHIREHRSPACLCNSAFADYLRGLDPDPLDISSPATRGLIGVNRTATRWHLINRTVGRRRGFAGLEAMCSSSITVYDLHDEDHPNFPAELSVYGMERGWDDVGWCQNCARINRRLTPRIVPDFGVGSGAAPREVSEFG